MKLKIKHISDTHGKIPEWDPTGYDFLIYTGDHNHARRNHFDEQGEQFEELNIWFENLKEIEPNLTIIFQSGNHDFLIEYDVEKLKRILSSAYVVSNPSFKLKGIKFFANSLVPNLKGWALYASEFKRQNFFRYWKAVNPEVDIVLSHSPPYEILDKAPRPLGSFEHTGCKYFEAFIRQIKPKYVLFGHIHEEFGKEIRSYKKGHKTIYINSALMDDNYNLREQLGHDFEIEVK